MTTEPVFVVGAPRSGTTLLAAMLAAHSQMNCGPETHFFRRLAQADTTALTHASTWPTPALDFVCSISHAGFGGQERRRLIDKYQLAQEQIAAYLSERQPSIRTLLSSVVEQHMVTMGKRRWVEKTPDHIEYLPLIREHFPAARIVRIVRDPRDVAISLTKVPWGTSTLVEGLLVWKRLDDASHDFCATDPLAYTLRYEDLVSTPRAELVRLCRFLGEEFEEAMLDTSQTGKELNSRNVPWKDRASRPVDTSRVAAWRSELTQQQNQLAESVLGDRLSAYGYPRDVEFTQLAEVFPQPSLATKYPDAFAFLASQGVRLWRQHEHEQPTARVYVGDPADSWLQGARTRQLIATLSIAFGIVRTIVTRHRVYWIPGDEQKWSGRFAGLLKQLLSPYRLPQPGSARH
jgi:hypothetical protein